MKLWDVWYDFEREGCEWPVINHVNVVADDIPGVLEVVKYNTSEEQGRLNVYSVKLMTEKVLT